MILRPATTAAVLLSLLAFAAFVQAIDLQQATASSPSASCKMTESESDLDPSGHGRSSVTSTSPSSFELRAPTVHRLTEPYCFDVETEIPRRRCQWERYEHDDGAGSSLRWKCRPARPLTVRWTRCVDRNVNHYLHYVALPSWYSSANAASLAIV